MRADSGLYGVREAAAAAVANCTVEHTVVLFPFLYSGVWLRVLRCA